MTIAKLYKTGVNSHENLLHLVVNSNLLGLVIIMFSVFMLRKGRQIFQTLLLILFVAGCSGTRPFHEYARAGDTVAIAAGWKENFSRDRITVYITPSDGSPDIVVGPDDPSIRAVVNFYPDPLSSIVVSGRTGQDITPSAQLYGDLINNNFTNGEEDWFQTVVFLDLPTTLPTGTTNIYMEDPKGASAQSVLEIVSGTGTPNTFSAESAGPLTRGHLAAMERASYYKISFSGSTVPYAIQLDLTHDPDKDASGVGKAYAVNPISGIKNVSWTDDGVSMRVILTPSAGTALTNFNDFRFYVAGGIQNLSTVVTTAYDINGNVVPGVVMTLVAHDIALATN